MHDYFGQTIVINLQTLIKNVFFILRLECWGISLFMNFDIRDEIDTMVAGDNVKTALMETLKGL